MNTQLLREQIDSGLLLRHAWSDTDENGRQRLCAYTALLGDPDARPTKCPSVLMPRWMAELIPWMDDSGTKKNWLPNMRRLAAVAERWPLTPAQWEAAHRTIRVGIIRESLAHITVDAWGVREACEAVIAAIQSGDETAAAAAAARATAVAAERAAAATAKWVAWVAEAAAKAVAEARATWVVAKWAAASNAEAEDRIIDMILTTLEAA